MSVKGRRLGWFERERGEGEGGRGRVDGYR